MVCGFLRLFCAVLSLVSLCGFAVFVPPLRPALKRIPLSIRSSSRSKLFLITQVVSLILIRWIVIYPADGAMQLLNHRGLISSFLNDIHGSDGFQLNFQEKTNVSFSN